MAENINEVHTGTNTVTKTENKEQTTVFITSKYNISAPLFLMFAEYLGYVSRALTWVDNWCVAKKRPQPWQIKFIETEAYIVLEEAKKKYTEKKIRELYDSLYEVILFLYDNNLKDLESKTI